MNINLCKWFENGKTHNVNICNKLGDKNKDRKKKQIGLGFNKPI
jgi:hypothetical protein